MWYLLTNVACIKYPLHADKREAYSRKGVMKTSKFVMPQRVKSFRVTGEGGFFHERGMEYDVPLIDVATEVGPTFPIGPGGYVEYVDRYGAGQRHRLRDFRLQGLLDGVTIPVLVFLKHVGGEVKRFFYADAAGTEAAHCPVEKVPVGRIVKVDVESVGKHEFNASQRIVRSRAPV